MQQNSLMKSTLVYCILFVAAAMGVMLYYASTKTVKVADLAQDEVVASAQQEETVPAVPTQENEIVIDRSEKNTNYFCVPLPENVKAEEVVLENHYMDKELWVGISSEQAQTYETFYNENGVYGNCNNVTHARY